MSLLHYFREIVVALVWVLANVVYVDLRRKGIGGFTRFAAFWVGQPATWIPFFAVREGQQPAFHAPDDDDEGRLLLDDIRRDRAFQDGADAFQDGADVVGEGGPRAGGDGGGAPGDGR